MVIAVDRACLAATAIDRGNPRDRRAPARGEERASPTPRSSTASSRPPSARSIQLAGRVDRIRKYDGPVRVFADGNRPDRKAAARQGRRRYRQRVQHLDIAMTDSGEDANVTVKLVRDRDLYRTIARPMAASAPARSRLRSIRNACPASARTSTSRSSIPTSSSPSTTAISSSSIAPMRSCCSRSARSTTPARCPGPCSTTRSRWASSTSTTSTSSTCSTIRASRPA